ncbi:MAG: TM2 domain-containing protein [Chitinophagales bacterium]|nr:TM2 domain-containing protein [Chitinophagales bacterium]
MNPDNTIMLLPYSTPEERIMLTNLLLEKTVEEKSNFMKTYILQRKDPQQILLFTLIGFLGFAGIQRFVIDEIGMGIIYFLTGGFCLIGTIIDAIRYKEIAFEYNKKMASLVYNTVFS